VSEPGTGIPGRQDARRPPALVRLVWRLLVAQAAAAAAVGLPFSRRHLPSILITLSLVMVVCLVAVLARTGTRTAWLAVFGFEAVFFLYGLVRFVSARYVGGTLMAAVVVGTLLHPGVIRAYSMYPGRLAGQEGGEMGLGDAAGDAFGERATG
jgi:O-antigen ligase